MIATCNPTVSEHAASPTVAPIKPAKDAPNELGGTFRLGVFGPGNVLPPVDNS
jgi:hypothetical protein